MTSKERASLRGMANGIQTILQIGKSGVTDEVVTQVKEALLARELIKMRVLENAPVSAREAAQELAEKTGAEPVQVIGTRFVLYKQNPEDPKIVL